MTENQTPHSSQSAGTGYKRLTRSRTDRKISGVCGGLAEYLNVDPTLVRLLVVVGTIITGGTLAIAYLVAMIIMPESPEGGVWNYPQQPPQAPQPPSPSPSQKSPPAEPPAS